MYSMFSSVSDSEMSNTSEIKKFYDRKSILVTGPCGFIGKVLLWKLLNSCPGIENIYVLIRSKNGRSVQERLEKLMNTPVFDEMRKNRKDLLKKLIAVAGDIAVDGLGLSDDDRKLLVEKVSIVFHSAATLNMESDLKIAVNMNVTGTRRLLELASNMEKLEVFIHISTAYCYCDQEITEERVISPKIEADKIINVTEWMSSDMLKNIVPMFLDQHPNTYTYTKQLTENIVAKHYPQLPVVICRPSIVTPAFEEPLPGWVDNINGPIGLFIAAGGGIIQSVMFDGSKKFDAVPVDIACNAFIVSAWEFCSKIENNEEKSEQIPVINVTFADMKPRTYLEVSEMFKALVKQYPYALAMWNPQRGFFTLCPIIFYFIDILFHWIPAYLVDLILVLLRQKPILVNLQKRIHLGAKVLQYFTLREWKFQTTNLHNMKNRLNANDRKEFPVTLENIIDLFKYQEKCILGTQRFILKYNPADTPKYRRRMKIVIAVDTIIRILFISLLLWFCCLKYIFSYFGI